MHGIVGRNLGTKKKVADPKFTMLQGIRQGITPRQDNNPLLIDKALIHRVNHSFIEPFTDEQIFHDKFLCGKLFCSSVRSTLPNFSISALLEKLAC